MDLCLCLCLSVSAFGSVSVSVFVCVSVSVPPPLHVPVSLTVSVQSFDKCSAVKYRGHKLRFKFPKHQLKKNPRHIAEQTMSITFSR